MTHGHHPHHSADNTPRISMWLRRSPLVIGLAAILWILFRVIPKPSRAAYPCMRVATSMASLALLQVGALLVSGLSLQKARALWSQASYRRAVYLLALAFAMPNFLADDAQSIEVRTAATVLTSNQPIGRARGIFPGRVVWVHDSAATNSNCSPGTYGNGWFLTKNSSQSVIDSMLSNGLQGLTGQTTDSAAWDAIFRFHNQAVEKGNVGYAAGERIFIKTNATSSWYGNINTSDLSIVQNSYYGISETSPQIVLAVLRQLVNTVGVAQKDISIGDPLRHIYKHCYDLWHAEFPNVHYLDHDGYDGREKVVPSKTAIIHYSDHGAYLHTTSGVIVTRDTLYTVFDSAAYVLNIPMLKGHKYAGITEFAKNNFGSHTRSDASHLHNGLVAPPDDPIRTGYGLYRVQVDLLGHSLLGKKILVYIMDALWATDHELDIPQKWNMAPFNGDWMSSIFLSFDPVAIESVGYDFLKAEFTTARGLSTYVQMDGVDDYLHQAADSTTWPTGITYDPDSTGTPIASLGVNEHWNNDTSKQYSRNLGTGDGIELFGIMRGTTSVSAFGAVAQTFRLSPCYPNPFNPSTTIRFELSEAEHVSLRVFSTTGQMVCTLFDGNVFAGTHTMAFDASNLASGMYFLRMDVEGSTNKARGQRVQKLVLVK